MLIKTILRLAALFLAVLAFPAAAAINGNVPAAPSPAALCMNSLRFERVRFIVGSLR